MTDWIVGSSILIVMIFAIRKVFGMRISSRFRYALWAVVMIRLLCPVTLWNNQQLVHNITEVSRQMFQNTSGTKVDKVDSNAELGMENGQNAGVGDASNTDRTKNDYTGNVKNQNVNMGQQNEQEINQTENLKITLGHNVFNQTGKETTAQQPEENSQSKDSNSNIFHSIIAQLISIAPAIWLYGSIAAGCWFAIVNMRFYHMLMRSRKQIDSSRKLLVYQVSGLSSPCLFGIIHPAIYLKEETKLKDDQILMILQHEICHYQHKDHIWSVMRSLCVAVWWWNPLVWAAAAESKRDCEMACDEGTLETIGWENKFLYAKTLVDAVSDKKNFGMTAASTMVSGKSDTERRLRMMLNKKKTKMASVVLAAVLMLNAAALCFGGESTAKSETQTNTAKQTALPVLAAVDVYEQIPITDDVEEFCETFGLLDKECIAQITPEWMKDSGIKLFRDGLNERVYLTWQNQLMTLPQLAIGKFIMTSDVDMLSSALADLDDDGVYEVYFTARAKVGGDSFYANMIGVARLTDMSFYWDFDAQEQMNQKSKVMMLTQNESNELIWSEASYKKADDENKRTYYNKPSEYALTPTDEKNEHPVTLSEESFVVSPIDFAVAGSQTVNSTEASANLNTSGWLIPTGGPRWSWTVDDLKKWYGDAAEIISEDESKTIVEISDVYIWQSKTSVVATVDAEVGVTRLDYKIADNDRDAIFSKMNSTNKTNQILGGTKEGNENISYRWAGKQAATLELAMQRRYREICMERGTWLDTEEKRYANQIKAQMTITSDECELSFEGEPEMVILYCELLDQSSAETEKVIESFNQLYKEDGDSWLLQWNTGLTTMSDYQSINLEENREDKPLHEMAHLLIENAQPYPAGGFGEGLYEMGFSFLTLSLKQSDADLTLNLYKDANTGAGFILREDGSGYIMIALQNENDAQVGLFSFTPCDTGKELYNKTLEEINKYNKIVVQ